MRPLSHVLALAAALGVCLCAVSASARPGDGITILSFVFSPNVDVACTWDSNVYKDKTNAIPDTFLEPELGMRFSSSADTNRFSLVGNVFYSERSYSKEKNRDFNTFGDSLSLTYGQGKRSSLEIVQSYRHVDDNDRHASDIETSDLAAEMIEDSNTLDLERDIHQFGGEVMRRFTDKLELGLSYRYSGVFYDNVTHDRLDPKQLFVPYGLDLEGHIFQFDGALQLTDKTDATITYRHGHQYQEFTEGSSVIDTLRIGLQAQGAEKLIYHAGVGYERYQRPGQTSEEATEVLSFNFAADWFMTEKLTFRCGGYNGTQFSSFYLENGVEYVTFWAGLGYRWKPNITFSVRGIYRNDDYLDPVMYNSVLVDRDDDRIEGHARIDYIAPGGFLRLFVEGTYDEVLSNLDFVEYVDERIILGGQLRY